jgi:hypothetical protein
MKQKTEEDVMTRSVTKLRRALTVAAFLVASAQLAAPIRQAAAKMQAPM